MKLIQPHIVSSEPAKRQKTDIARPIEAIEAVERPKPTGSYSTSYSANRPPIKFVEQNQQAINSYLDTASLSADNVDGGELIGIDTYA